MLTFWQFQSVYLKGKSRINIQKYRLFAHKHRTFPHFCPSIQRENDLLHTPPMGQMERSSPQIPKCGLQNSKCGLQLPQMLLWKKILQAAFEILQAAFFLFPQGPVHEYRRTSPSQCIFQPLSPRRFQDFWPYTLLHRTLYQQFSTF